MAKKSVPTIDELIESGQIVVGSDPSLELKRIPTTIPQLDDLLGGGIVLGKNYLFVGPESTGKTLLAQYFVAAIQRAHKEGLVTGDKALLVDTEHSFDRGWWARSGVDVDSLYVTQPATAEEAIDIIAMAAAVPDFSVIVLDSIANLTPTVEIENPTSADQIGILARRVTKMYHKLMSARRSGKTDPVFIAINQLRDNLQGYDDVYPGGRSQRHNSHVILRLRREGWLTEKGERIGQNLEIVSKKDKLGGKFGATCQIVINFETQFDIVTSYIDEAIERGLIAKSGPYFRWGDENFLGKAALREHFADLDEFEKLRAALG